MRHLFVLQGCNISGDDCHKHSTQSALAAGGPDAAGGAQGLGSGFVLGTADTDVGGALGAADVGGPAAIAEPPRLPNREAKGLAAPPAAVGVVS